MAGELIAFSFNNVAAFIGSVPVEGFTEGDDVLLIEPGADPAQYAVGADGDVVLSLTTNRSALITLKLHHASETHKYLTSLYNRMVSGNMRTFSFSAVDTGTGEGGYADTCAIVKKPANSYGAQAGSREWQLLAASWQESGIVYGG